MTIPTKQVAMGFSASAFLTPKHLPADKLLEWVDKDDLKKLKPSAEQVRDAILLCKQHGLTARFYGGLALSISGNAEILYTCFGVRLMIDSDPTAKERKWFEDDAGTKQDLVKPVANHPLGKHIVNVVLEAGIEPTINAPPLLPPHFPGKTGPWEKGDGSHPIHMWPDELRDRIRYKEDPSTRQKVNLTQTEQNLILPTINGSPFCVSIVDTGLNGLHPYFHESLGNRLQIGQGGNSPMYWPIQDHFTAVRDSLTCQVDDGKTLIRKLLILVKQLPNDLWINPSTKIVSQNQFLYIDSGSNVQLNWNFARRINDVQLQIYNKVESLRNSPYYRKYRGEAQWVHTSNLLSEVTFNIINKRVIRTNAISATAFNKSIGDMTGLFIVYLELSLQRLNDVTKWLETYGKENYDYSGHGTGMAASVFGVVRTAHVASFPAISTQEQSDYQEMIGTIQTDLLWVFQQTGEWANQKQLSTKSNPNIIDPVEYRVISNSYSSSIAMGDDGKISQSASAQLNNWRKLILSLVNNFQFTILFSAGNSHNPVAGKVSLFALLGDCGAIIVGGAFDYWDDQKRRIISLSNAAHGMMCYKPYADPVLPENPLPSLKPITIPDIYGFVGPEFTPSRPGDLGFQHAPYVSPYVYLPTKENGWSYYGGGTSSACAQVAALCGAIRAKYNNLDLSSFKKIIQNGGDAVTEGTSYQGVRPSDLSDIRLANLLGAFNQASKEASKVHMPSGASSSMKASKK